MLLAYKLRLLRNKASAPKVIEGELQFYHEDWRIGRTMGSETHHATRSCREGFGLHRKRRGDTTLAYRSNDLADIRIVPDAVAEIIHDYDKQIARLQTERQEFISYHFMTFPLPTIEQAQIHEGQSKREAEAAAKQANKNRTISQAALASERRISGALNRAIADTCRK